MTEYRDPTDFQDPLENFEPKVFNDPLEQALSEESVEAIQSSPFVSVPPDTSIRSAIEQLAELHVACLLIEDKGRLVGVFTDRDAMDRVALEYEQLQSHPVSEVMTTNPVFVYDTDSAGAVLAVMAVSGFRHVPVLDLNKTISGIASPQRVTDFLQQHFAE